MCSARPSWMSISQQTLGYKDTLYKVAVDLPDVLEIDTKNMVVRVEPSVTIGIYKFTLEDHVCFNFNFYL
jgi:delta24-sterol reductase